MQKFLDFIESYKDITESKYINIDGFRYIITPVDADNSFYVYINKKCIGVLYLASITLNGLCVDCGNNKLQDWVKDYMNDHLIEKKTTLKNDKEKIVRYELDINFLYPKTKSARK